VAACSGQITLQPPVVNLALYAGDGASIRLVLDNVMGAIVPLAGSVTAQIRAARTDATAAQSFAVDLSEAADGVALLSLTGDQTDALAASADFVGVWDVEYTATGEEPLTLVQGKATVKKDVTRP
jgi:hypothetical protein